MNLKSYFFRILATFFSLFFILVILEVLCRFFVNFEMDYYSSPRELKNKKFIEHPYGRIPINSLGFYDGEFDFTNNKPKIAYFGDSVTYGVGAGFPYRFTEILDKMSPEFDHLNFSSGLGSSLLNWNESLEKIFLDKKISRIIYMMNLNDIAPLSNYFYINDDNKLKKIKDLNSIKNFIAPFDELFRGKSMLYTFIRYKIKNIFIKKGFEATGFESIELFPERNRERIMFASKYINNWSSQLEKKGIKVCVVILPYEMQISENAKNYYKSIGIKFSKNFTNFMTQKIIKDNIDSQIDTLILRENFINKKIGHYFVFNKGDKVDYNHPNRNGHQVIANEISKYKICQI